MIGQLARKAGGMLVRKVLRRHVLFIVKLPIMALGMAGLLLTTDLLDTLKTVWNASDIAATSLEHAIQTNQQQHEQQSH